MVAGAPEDLQIVVRPIGVGEEGHVGMAQHTQVDAQPTRGAVFQDDLRKIVMDAF
jgi:hypothetical protein